MVKNRLANGGDVGDTDSLPGQEDPLEEEMTTHSSMLAWKNPMDRAPAHGATKSQTRPSH